MSLSRIKNSAHFKEGAIISLIFPKGCCCLGSQCEHPDGELRPIHICTKCKKYVPQKCAIFDRELDELVCKVYTKANTSEGGSETSLVFNQIVPHNHKGQNGGYTAITDSEKMKVIPKDYFVTKGQRVNKEMMEKDPKWLDLKGKVQTMIDSALKEEMVLEAQRIKLEYGGENHKLLVDILGG